MHSFLRILSHLLKKSLIGNFIFRGVMEEIAKLRGKIGLFLKLRTEYGKKTDA